MADDRLIELGRVSGVLGLKGWIKIFSHTDPRENILNYESWILSLDGTERRCRLEEGALRGKLVVAKLESIDDREAAETLVGATIAVPRVALPECGPGEYYWADLEGLAVRDLGGAELGVVDHLLETGAHDVLVLAGPAQSMIPFVLDEVVKDVDLAAGVITVDWTLEEGG